MYVKTYLEKLAETIPEKVALIVGDNRLTYRELYIRAKNLAVSLLNRGISKGDKIAITLINEPQFVDIYFATLSLGAVLVPLDFRLKPDEIMDVLEDSEPALLFTTAATAQNLEKVPSLRDMYCVDGPSLVEGVTYEELIAETDEAFPVVEVTDTDEALHLYTSGSTGRPKGVVLTVAHLEEFPLAVLEIYPDYVTPDKVFAVVLPLSHIGGLVMLNLLVSIGGTMVLFEGMRPDVIWKTIERERVVWFVGVPPIMQLLLMDSKIDSYDISCLEFIALMGMSVPKALMEECVRRFTHLDIVQGYGMTETSPLISILPTKDASRKRGSVGIPVSRVEVKIVDEDGNELPVGQSGEIIVRGPMVMKGYYNNPEETDETIRDGWLHTGDLGALDEEGYLYHMGRSKEMIITGGLNVYPAEVENALLKHLDVMDAVVIGVPDDLRGEVVKAFVVPREGVWLTEQDLLKFSRKQLADFKAPRDIVFIKKVPSLGMGKIDKQAFFEDRYETI